MTFIRRNSTSLIALSLYYIWWLYLVFVFNSKEYDNNYAGGTAVELIAFLTCIIIVVGLIFFLVSAFRTKEWIKYVTFTLLLFIPVLLSYIITVLNE